MGFNIRRIKGVGEKRAMLLEKMELRTVGDVLYDFPFRYKDRTQPSELFFRVPEGEVLFKARVTGKYVSRKALFLEVASELAKIKITYFNAVFLDKRFLVGAEYYFYGTVRDGAMANPEFSPAVDSSFLRIIPVYRLTEGLSQNISASIHEYAVEMLKREGITENLPAKIVEDEELMSRQDAIMALHAPKTFGEIEKAGQRMIFEELFLLFVEILSKKKKKRVTPFPRLSLQCLKKIPFPLTDSQKKAISDIQADLESGFVMNRLINGDVGSGKSVVAFAAAKMVASSGSQVLVMAPTTVLAEQLYKGYTSIYGEEGVAVLTSKLSGTQKSKTYRAVKERDIQVLFGTHAVLSEDLVFPCLDLVITDEQQRFGIDHRRKALEKSRIPHNLYLTATPIPRTLAMTFFAHMDVSRIEEKPSGRIPVTTRFIGKKEYVTMLRFIQSRIDAGEQIYVVTPAINGERGSVESAEKVLKKRLRARTACIHGEMKSEQAERVMREFQQKEIDVLVATTMIEVGVDNPNATVMVIVNCERFGLSQLHQLRGRVGRGKARSHCFLLSDKPLTERMRVILDSDNGFRIAEKDLEIRGPGEFLGNRQSGAFRLRFPFGDADVRRAYSAAETHLGIK
ncbi:MAG: ATP-dependent DNA helicase RecG [Bacillota bacterium]|nr:ATP-dependent DNA helicase RecG [Bacillota bacterium]